MLVCQCAHSHFVNRSVFCVFYKPYERSPDQATNKLKRAGDCLESAPKSLKSLASHNHLHGINFVVFSTFLNLIWFPQYPKVSRGSHFMTMSTELNFNPSCNRKSRREPQEMCEHEFGLYLFVHVACIGFNNEFPQVPQSVHVTQDDGLCEMQENTLLASPLRSCQSS